MTGQTLNSFEKTCLWLVKIGLWTLPVLTLFVSASLTFPFITGKNFTFRIIVEIIFAFWVGLAMARPEYRPRLTPIFKAVTIFVAVIFLADILSPNPYRALFSSYERMDGFITLGHLYLYFLMLGAVFRQWRDWTVFFHVMLAVSAVISGLALLQKFGYRIFSFIPAGSRVDSIIGNPIYLAGYLVFHVWLILLLMHQWWQKWWLRLLYFFVLIFELSIIYFTATRGAVLALAVTSILFLIALVIWWPKVFPRWASRRSWGIGILFFLILAVPVGYWQIENTNWAQASPIWQRLTNYHFQGTTVQARFRIWKMSWQGFWERPWLGWGQENFYLVFQKYYDPGLYGEDPWFDRAHNIVFDWLISGGFFGLLSYLAIFAAAFLVLRAAVRRRLISFWEGLVVSGLFLSYFIQNIFVFDNLITYLLFFSFLGYVQIMSEPGEGSAVREKIQSFRLAPALTIFLLAVFLAVGYFIHWKPIRASQTLLRAMQVYYNRGSPDQLLPLFREALKYSTFGDTEVREQISNAALDLGYQTRLTTAERKRLVEFAVEEVRKQIKHPAKDVKHILYYGGFLARAAALDPKYGPEAVRALEEAARLSPDRQIIYLELSRAYLTVEQLDKALAAARQAWEKNKQFREAGANFWLLALAAKKTDIVDAIRAELNFIDLNDDTLAELARVYRQVGDAANALAAEKAMGLNSK